MISENIRVFWQPHLTSCIRVKDYLKHRGIEYESVNIVEDGMEDLQKLGAKSVPVVSRGEKFVFAQVIRDVVEFLELDKIPVQNWILKNWQKGSKGYLRFL